MKRLAIIGASYLQLPLVKKAKEMGVYTLCFAWEEGAVCKGVADEFYPISIVEKERILQVCREKQIDGICTIASDVAAPTVAFVAEHLGLVGNSYEVALRSSNKYQMRNAFVMAGVPCPKYQVVTTTDEVHGELDSPLIVKPTDRSGSLGITKVTRQEGLVPAVDNALGCSFKHEAILEEFIEGREISVEFISYQGKHYPLQITDKVTTGAPHFVELEHHQPADLNREQVHAIYELTERALNALGVTNGASHSEYKITADGKVVVMEIGARMGGDFIGSDLVYLSTGYDYLKGVIDVALGRFEKPTFGTPHCSGVFFLCEETRRLRDLIKKGDAPQIVRSEITDHVLHRVKCSADRSGYMIYQGDKRLEL
ncbi:MAG: ATP-grasp domain-containing protein [Bacteroidales bacterium]|nr:ATP-grasp domain-containing protein [Bacteroidales bacterium]